jgi:hypothetical protein
MHDVPQQAFFYHAAGRLIEGTVTALETGLQHLRRARVGELSQRVNLLRPKNEALLTEHMLAREQGIARDGEVLEQGCGHQHRVNIRVVEERPVIRVSLYLTTNQLACISQVGLVNVA